MSLLFHSTIRGVTLWHAILRPCAHVFGNFWISNFFLSGFKNFLVHTYRLYLESLPNSPDACGRKPYPERKSYGSKNIRIHVDGAEAIPCRAVPWRVTPCCPVARHSMRCSGMLYYVLMHGASLYLSLCFSLATPWDKMQVTSNMVRRNSPW